MIHTAVTWPRFAYALVCGSIDHAGMRRRGLSLSNAPINTQLTDTIPMLNPVMGVDTGPAQKLPPGSLMTDGH